MKALLYCRVSSAEQVADGNSLVTQERILTEIAVKRGYEPVLFIEKGESAKTTDRTKLQEMMAYSVKNKKEIEVLMFYKVDRLARDTADYLTLKKYFNQLGIHIESASERLEDSPFGRFAETMLASSAQMDNEVRAERCKNGMIEAVMGGRYVWQAPIGYVNTKVNGEPNIAPSPNRELVEKVREIWQLIDSGLTPEQTRQKINKTGLVELWGRPISKSHFYKTLDSVLYKGVIRKFGLEIISDSIVPLIEPNLFDRVNLKLHSKKKSGVRYQKINPKYPLRGLLVCKSGHHITASPATGNGGKYEHYHCVRCRGGNNNFAIDKVHKQFKAFLDGFEYDQTYKELLGMAIKENWIDKYQESKKRVGQLETKISELEAKKRQIVDKNFKGVIGDSDAKIMLDETNLDIANLRMEQHEAVKYEDNLDEVTSFGFDVLSKVGDVWLGIEDVEIKYRFQNFLFPSKVAFDGIEFRTNNLPLCLRIKTVLLSENSSKVDPAGIEPATSSM